MDFFCGDHHFGDDGIIKFCNRPFLNEAMATRGIVEFHNSVVTPRDTVYFGGDLSMKYGNDPQTLKAIISSMNGRKILIVGNHDTLSCQQYIDIGFESVHTYFRYSDKIIIHHDPCASIVFKDCLFLCGHIHDLFRYITGKNVINIGLDVWNWKPVSYAFLMEFCNQFKVLGSKRWK